MNKFYPDWVRITSDLNLHYRSDDKLCDALSSLGILVDRSTIARLRIGDDRNPLYPLGAGLMELHEEVKCQL